MPAGLHLCNENLRLAAFERDCLYSTLREERDPFAVRREGDSATAKVPLDCRAPEKH